MCGSFPARAEKLTSTVQFRLATAVLFEFGSDLHFRINRSKRLEVVGSNQVPGTHALLFGR